MFRDTDEALARLEAELLREEEHEEYEAYEEYEEYEEYDDAFEDPRKAPTLTADQMYNDTRAAADPVVYQNFSNDYGQNVYNADITDTDPEEYSQALLEDEEKSSGTGLLILACVLCLGVVAVLLYLLFLYRGGL